MIEDYRDLEPIPEHCNDFIADVSTRFWSVVEKRGQVYHEVKSYKRKQDAVSLLIKLKSESLTDYKLVSILNGC